jgi:transposase
MRSMIHVGLDVHKDKVVAYLLCVETGETWEDALRNDREALRRAVRKWSAYGPLRVCYEASGAGFVLQRWLSAWDVPCEVIAPSRTPRAAGERVKTDRRDARKLAVLYAAGALQAVRVPSAEEETVRAVVRLREEVTRDMTRSKNRVVKYLLTLGQVYREGDNWTAKYRAWLKQLPLEPLPRMIVTTHLAALDGLTQRREELDARIATMAQQEPYRTWVGRLMCLRGVGLYTAMVLATELGDVRRFATAPQLMSYWGLVPKEHSSGARQRRGGITKTGSSRVRWLLGEAAWRQTRRPAKGGRLPAQRATQSAEVVAIAQKAEQRLHQRYWHLAQRKDRKTAATAVARELVGFVWAILQV